MAFSIPTDLIHGVQISLRKEAGLSDYDPSDPTLPSLPSLDESISAFDPSPPYLRCNHCKGRLLRGLQSFICVYCGKHRQNDVPPDPISFNSSFGYKWLLDSLDLDGSERVGASVENDEFKRGQRTPKEDISLSKLLDLKITWPSEWEKPETSVTNKTLNQSKNSLNVTGVDLDDFFSGPRGDAVLNASQELPGINKQIESTKSISFASQDNLSLFPNAQPSETKIRSSGDEIGDAFSGWEADFQSADSGNEHGSFKRLDPFIGSTVNLSTGLDSVSVPAEDLTDRKLKNDSAPSPSVTNEWTEEVGWNSALPAVPQQAEQIDPTMKLQDDLEPLSVTNDWIPSDIKVNSVVHQLSAGSGNEHGSFKRLDPFIGSTVDLSTGIDSVSGPAEDKKDGKPKNDSAPSPSVTNDWTGDDECNSALPAVPRQAEQIETMKLKDDLEPLSVTNDWIPSDIWNTVNSEVPQQPEQFDAIHKAKGGLMFDNVNNPPSTSIDWTQDDSWQTNTTSALNNKTINEVDYSFDAWNDFTSSTTAPDPSKNAWTQSGNQSAAVDEQDSERNFFSSTNNFEDMDFGSFLQSDLSPGSTGNQNGYSEENNVLSEVAASDRIADAKNEVSGDAGHAARGGAVFSPTPKNDVEMLLSQMHDLSFMLEGNLSVPSKSDNPNSFPLD